MDPISLLGIATTAFATIKKGFEFGRDAESMIKDIGRFMHSIDDLKHTHDKSKKKKFGSVEEESLETYVALKKARKMEDELRNFMIASYGMNAWNDILRIQAQLRKERQEEIARKKKEQEEMIKIGFTFLAIIALIVLGFIIYKNNFM
tara:strand:- start:273 stop:716 length:444 start_codon:yes stop_codon:yes gene_type:complete